MALALVQLENVMYSLEQVGRRSQCEEDAWCCARPG